MRILRSQLETYIKETLGESYLPQVKNKAESRKIKTEIGSLQKKLSALQKRKKELEEFPASAGAQL